MAIDHRAATTRFRRVTIACAVLILVIFTAFFFRTDTGADLHRTISSTISHEAPAIVSGKDSFQDLIQKLYAPTLLPITAPSFKDPLEEEPMTIGPNPIWTKPLGKRLCIIDIDTRSMDGENEIFDPNVPISNASPFNWPDFGNTPAGMMGHYLYAMVHGYDYAFIKTTSYDDRAPFWTKIPALADHLHKYDFVISIDADAQFRFPQVPFEWLLNRWNVTKETSFTMAIDPDDPPNHDVHGRVNDNAGFIVAQNLPRTHEMLRAWHQCPDEPSDTYKDCGRWKYPWPAEQAAFAEYIRYNFNGPNDVHEIPCDEANGTPDFTPWEQFQHGCKGRFVRHHTLSKAMIKESVVNAHMGVLMGRVHEEFLKEKDEGRYVHRLTNDIKESAWGQ